MKQKISNAFLLQAEKWRNKNEATWSDAAKEFGFSSGDSLWQAYNKRKKAGKLIPDNSEEKIKRPYKKRKKSSESFNIEIKEPKQSTIAFAIVPISEAKAFIGELW